MAAHMDSGGYPDSRFVPGVVEDLARTEFDRDVLSNSQATVLAFLFSNSMSVSRPIAECPHRRSWKVSKYSKIALTAPGRVRHLR